MIISASILQLGSKLVGMGKGQGSLSALTSHPACDVWQAVRVPISNASVAELSCSQDYILHDILLLTHHRLMFNTAASVFKKYSVAVWLGCRCGTCHSSTVYLKLEVLNSLLSESFEPYPSAYIKQKCICFLPLFPADFVSKLRLFWKTETSLKCRMPRHYIL